MPKKPEIQTTGESDLQATPEAKKAPDVIEAAQTKGQKMIERALPDEKSERQEWSAQKFENEINRLQKENPQSLTSFAEKHSELLKTIGIDTALKVLEVTAKRPFAKDILLFFAAKEPTITIADTCELASISKQPYYNEVLDMAIRSRPSIIFEFADIYQEKGFDVQKILLKGADEDPWGFAENFEDLKAYLPGKAEVFLAQQKERIKIAERGSALPQKTIQAADLPINQQEFELFIMGANKETSGFIRFLSSAESRMVFFSKPFENYLKNQVGKMNYMNAFSMAQAISRQMTKESLAVTDKNIKKAVDTLSEKLESVTQKELFGPNTRLILLAHEEATFQTDEILEKIYYRSGGKKENVILVAKGVEMKEGKNVMKEKILEAIRNAHVGAVTILFSGHGHPENWTFSSDHHPALDHSLQPHPHNLSYQELGDTLMESGNIKNINLLGASCYSYDYFQNLFRYLESKGFKEKPAVSISFANLGQPSLGLGKELNDPMLEAIYGTTEKGTPIRVQHLFQAEGNPMVWRQNDPAIFSEGTEIV